MPSPAHLLALVSATIVASAAHATSTPPTAPLPLTDVGPRSSTLQSDLRGTRSLPLVIESVVSAEDVTEKREEAKYRAIDSSTARWIMLLTGGMLLVAVVQAIFFFVQLRLMRASMRVAQMAAAATERTVETMEDTARRQLRAYVSVDRAWIEFPEPGVPHVTVIIKNAGQTPAYDLRHWIHQWIERYPLEIQLPVPPDGFVMSSSLLGAAATHSMQLKHPSPIIRLPFIDEIGTPEATIYVYGEITYKDIFGTQQFLRYRLQHGGPTQPPPGVLSPCEEGNEAS